MPMSFGVFVPQGWCLDYPDTETQKRLARDVVPTFR